MKQILETGAIDREFAKKMDNCYNKAVESLKASMSVYGECEALEYKMLDKMREYVEELAARHAKNHKANTVKLFSQTIAKHFETDSIDIRELNEKLRAIREATANDFRKAGEEMHPACIKNSFKDDVIDLNNELTNVSMMQCMDWMMDQLNKSKGTHNA